MFGSVSLKFPPPTGACYRVRAGHGRRCYRAGSATKQRKCQRPDRIPAIHAQFLAASSTLRNSTGKINRIDRSGRQQCGRCGKVTSVLQSMLPALGIAWSWARPTTRQEPGLKFQPAFLVTSAKRRGFPRVGIDVICSPQIRRRQTWMDHCRQGGRRGRSADHPERSRRDRSAHHPE
jgi:hypothetical protein